ncbi:MAG: hypothetical protein M3N10_05440 [Actinomycetota bacterium]|nr:hypothetical protein [Actinomycetota bacterium]HZY65211.1 hypothetical protein [Rubrobacteraceae bacterium]
MNLADMNASTKAKTREQKAKAVNIRKKRRVLLSSQATYVAWLEGKEIRGMGKKYIGTVPDYFETPEKEAEKAASDDQTEDDGEDTDTEAASPT